MKFNKIYIALGMVLALTSCKSDEPVPVEKTEPYMSFTISLSEEGTRADDNDRDPFGHDWDEDGDDEGIAFDRKIDNVTPVLYSAPGGTIVADVPVGQITDVTKVDNGDGTATFTGALKTDLNIDQLRAGNFRLADKHKEPFGNHFPSSWKSRRYVCSGTTVQFDPDVWRGESGFLRNQSGRSYHCR